MNKIKLAYLAGFIDGEGCVCLNKVKKKRTRLGFTLLPKVSISNTVSLDYMRKNSSFKWNKIKSFIPTKGKNNKLVYVLEIRRREEIKCLLRAILPFLNIKKERAKLLLEFCNRRVINNKQMNPYTEQDIETYERLRVLNKRGIK